MIKDLERLPAQPATASPLIVGDILFIVTANGVDEGHINIPRPKRRASRARQEDRQGAVEEQPARQEHHARPVVEPVLRRDRRRKQVIFPGGDGWLYGFDPDTGKLLWKFDCNPKDSMYELGGTGTRNDFIATPVVYDNKVYIGVGQDPEHTTGIANFFCFAPTKKGDISKFLETREKDKDGKEKIGEKPNPNSCEVWRYGVHQSLHRRVAANLALAHERRAVDRAERHRVAADVDVVLGVAGLDVELPRRLRHLLQHEVGVEEDRVVLDPLPGLAEQLERAVVHELDADLGHQPAPALVEGRHRLGGEHLVARHPVAEHRTSWVALRLDRCA